MCRSETLVRGEVPSASRYKPSGRKRRESVPPPSAIFLPDGGSHQLRMSPELPPITLEFGAVETDFLRAIDPLLESGVILGVNGVHTFIFVAGRS
jgi:hypothetical protein